MKIWGLGTILTEHQRPIIWVTNAASSLGSFLCEELIKHSARVLAIDNWKTGIEQNLAHLQNNKNFQLLEHDLTLPLPDTLPRPNYIFYLEREQVTPDISLSILRESARGTEQALEKASKNQAKFLFASSFLDEPKTARGQAAKFSQTLVSEFIKTRELDGRIVRLGNLFGPRMLLSPEDPLGTIFRNVIYKEEIKSEEGTVVPLFVKDAVGGLVACMFGGGTKGKTLAFALHEISLGGFAQIVKEVAKNPNSILAGEVLTGGIASEVLVAPTPIEVGVKETLEFFRENLSKLKGAPIGGKQVSRKRINLWSKLSGETKIFLSATVFFVLFWFLVLPFVSLFGGVAALSLSQKALTRGAFENAGRFSSFGEFSLALADSGISRLAVIPFLSSLRDQVRTGRMVARIASRLARAGVLGKNFFVGIVNPNTTAVSKEAISRLILDIESLAQELSFLKAEDSGLSEEIKIDHNRLFLIAQFARSLPEILGYQGKRTYLVLFQNNMELRPTGGFIGSFGLLTFEGGKLINIEIQDVYTADGQLVGHVEPPDKLREHLGEANWFLRDSNWDPDFPTSAQRAGWFLDKELGVRVDGVLSVDLEVVKKLISAVGPLKIEDFSTEVSATNFYEKTQFYAQEGFFPGSTQKKDFLTGVERTLTQKLVEDAGEKTVFIGHALLSSLRERHILIWLENKEAQMALQKLGWEGGIREVRCLPAQAGQMSNVKCLEDYLFVVEANLGVNKVNYNLSRSFLLELSFSQDKLLHDLAILYSLSREQGSERSKEKANLRYKNYLRIYTPQSSTIVSAALVNPATGEKTNINVDTSEEHKRKVFGMLVEVPAGETRQAKVTWEVFSGENASGGNLAFLWQKQAGTGEDPVTIRFHYPDKTHFTLSPPPSLSAGEAGLTEKGRVGYNTVFGGDLNFSATWTLR